MQSAVAIFLVVVAASAIDAAGSFSRPSIAPWEYRPTHSVAPRALNGITDCGVGRLVDVRLEGCSQAPCTLTRGQSVNLQVDFSPRDQHWDLSIRSILLQDTNIQTIAEGGIPDSTVNPGQTYTMNLPFTVPSGFTGAAEFRMILFQNYVQEVCLVIQTNVV